PRAPCTAKLSSETRRPAARDTGWIWSLRRRSKRPTGSRRFLRRVRLSERLRLDAELLHVVIDERSFQTEATRDLGDIAVRVAKVRLDLVCERRVRSGAPPEHRRSAVS